MAGTKDEGGRRPTLTLEPSIRVVLTTRREGDRSHTMFADDGSIEAFLNWQSKNKIFPMRGGVVGGGVYSSDFFAEDAEAIRDYFRSVGLLDDEG